MENGYCDIFKTDRGWVGGAWSGKGLRGIVLPRGNRRVVEKLLKRNFGKGRKTKPWQELRRQVKSYLKGDLRSFDIPLDLQAAGPFTEKVWQVVGRIPYGRTESYGTIARRAGSPRAARAVGSAMARNPVPLVIPCHRVTAADGLGGFSPSVELKAELLGLEAAGGKTAGKAPRKISGAAGK